MRIATSCCGTITVELWKWTTYLAKQSHDPYLKNPDTGMSSPQSSDPPILSSDKVCLHIP